MCTTYPAALTQLLTIVYRLRGPLVVGAWLRAVAAVVDRHEGLRIRFVNGDQGLVQVIDPPNGLEVEHIDLSGLPETAREDRARALLSERGRAAVDLEKGPLVASYLLRLAEDDHVWRLTVHHILADGASMAIVTRELCAFYHAFVHGTEPALPDLPIRYGDYLVWHHNVHHQQHDEDRRYWAQWLAGAPMIKFRTDLPRLASGDPKAAWIRHTIGGDLVERAAEMGRAARCTLYMVVLAAVQMLFVRYTGQWDFCFGIPVVGRHFRAELEPLVGLFSNLVTLRCDATGDPTFHEFVVRTRNTVLDALAHQDLPFSQVVPHLDVPPDDGRPQVFQALFDFNHSEESLPLPDLRVEGFPLAPPKSVHDLVIAAWTGRSGLGTRFVYNSAVFTADSVSEMARGLEELLCVGVERPDLHLSTLVAGSARSLGS